MLSFLDIKHVFLGRKSLHIQISDSNNSVTCGLIQASSLIEGNACDCYSLPCCPEKFIDLQIHKSSNRIITYLLLFLGGSMTSLSSPTPPAHSPAPSLSTSDLCERPRVSHGKPNLAPKPPAPAPDTRPSPPPKKLITNGKIAGRTQSMRVPR